MADLRINVSNLIITSAVFGVLSIIVLPSHVDAKNKCNSDTLQLVHVIFRHANRTPVLNMIYPSDPHINETYYPFGQQELTLTGKKNAYKFGLQIRERYNHILSKTYYPPEVQAFSSNMSRTQMTLQSVLAGLYPPESPNMLSPNLLWQPISYQTFPTTTDTLLDVYCRTINNFTTKMDPQLQELYDYVSQHTGKQIINSANILNVYDTILVEKQNGFDVPDWATEIFYNGTLLNAALTQWTDYIANGISPYAGPLMKKITEDSVRKTKNELANNIFLYSAHDINIVMFLGLFDAYSPTNKFEIEYLSHIYIELHKINDEYGFKVYFQNGLGYSLIQLKFKSCTADICPIDAFIKSTKDVYTPLTTRKLST